MYAYMYVYMYMKQNIFIHCFIYMIIYSIIYVYMTLCVFGFHRATVHLDIGHFIRVHVLFNVLLLYGNVGQSKQICGPCCLPRTSNVILVTDYIVSHVLHMEPTDRMLDFQMGRATSKNISLYIYTCIDIHFILEDLVFCLVRYN